MGIKIEKGEEMKAIPMSVVITKDGKFELGDCPTGFVTESGMLVKYDNYIEAKMLTTKEKAIFVDSAGIEFTGTIGELFSSVDDDAIEEIEI